MGGVNSVERLRLLRSLIPDLAA